MALVDRLARWLELKRRRDAAGAWRGPGAMRRVMRAASLPASWPNGSRERAADEPADTQPGIFCSELPAWR